MYLLYHDAMAAAAPPSGYSRGGSDLGIMPVKFKPGDIVNLKTCGPDMIIASVGDDGITCIWFDGKRDKRRAFPPETLRKKPKPPRRVELDFGFTPKPDRTSN
jgi:uncharacterized protein YodC (DUF2158 family)